uniref:Metalloendopeptidase n=1 Tax=Parastrongyloides trichosuri TaxID=131310 RepID=A0A0N4ZMT1_PARTI
MEEIYNIITKPVEFILENDIKVVGNVIAIDPETLNFIVVVFKNETEFECIEFIPKMTIINYRVLEENEKDIYPQASFLDKEDIEKIFEKILPKDSKDNMCIENIEERRDKLLKFLEDKKIIQKIINIASLQNSDIYELKNGFLFADDTKSILKVKEGDIGELMKYKWMDYLNEDNKYVIPYVINGNYGRDDLKILENSMKTIELNTCLSFRLRSTEKNYVVIKNKVGGGCYSHVGKIGGPQTLMLESNDNLTCFSNQIIIHELLHVIGLWHEHMRFDRDKYIKVIWKNIDKGHEIQFAKISPSLFPTFNLPYDYHSIMHYNQNAFTKNKNFISLAPYQARYNDVIGKSDTPTIYDYEYIYRMYKCDVLNKNEKKKKLVEKEKNRCVVYKSKVCVRALEISKGNDNKDNNKEYSIEKTQGSILVEMENNSKNRSEPLRELKTEANKEFDPNIDIDNTVDPNNRIQIKEGIDIWAQTSESIQQRGNK